MKRKLTPEEQELWRYVTRNDAPLHPPQTQSEDDISAAISNLAPPAREAFPKVKKWKSAMHTPLPAPQEASAPLTAGAYAGIDRSTAERFKKGDYPIDATLDLHGMTREKAHKALLNFLHRSFEKQARCLLVITGKGKPQAGRDAPHDAGVLRTLVPRWLAEPELKSRILAIEVARPKHGGSGAYYLLLRRKRA